MYFLFYSLDKGSEENLMILIFQSKSQKLSMFFEELDSIVAKLFSFLFEVCQLSQNVRSHLRMLRGRMSMGDTSPKSLVLFFKLCYVQPKPCIFSQRFIELLLKKVLISSCTKSRLRTKLIQSFFICLPHFLYSVIDTIFFVLAFMNEMVEASPHIIHDSSGLEERGLLVSGSGLGGEFGRKFALVAWSAWEIHINYIIDQCFHCMELILARMEYNWQSSSVT